ncbi:sugar ABC transporter ATP-binding protein [Microbacterium sp.]|uniref:sugar ABC transporter ATP-binding protein n=1 Tax=Microbacterium sp. TaxID=51671 RepID=UPI001AC31CAC|nr:sugar ABC transporter ATP-binding protein [Microbacterium sp.]MBN9193912.1 sugar ABC transporter ATP-binding protein [Microbacterium sp.]
MTSSKAEFASRPSAVVLDGVSKTFDGVTVLSDLSLRVAAGTVHAILGGNGSGKSTTLKLLAGVYAADPGGRIEVAGTARDASAWAPQIAYDSGLRFVHQDLGLVEDLTVMENFGLANGFPRSRLGGIRWSALRRDAVSALGSLGIRVDPRRKVGVLSPSEKTMVAIARALGTSRDGANLTIVLDEPTASLPASEVDLLLETIRACRRGGQTILYVSHRLPEVFDIADTISVLRDGRLVATEPTAALNEREVISFMTGNAPVDSVTPRGRSSVDLADPLLRVEGLSTGPLREVDLAVRAGEIVGLAGLSGSGRSSLLRTLFGVQKPTGGAILIDGSRAELPGPADAIERGFALVPEDRKREGLFLDRPVWENISTVVLARYWRGGFFRRRAERADSAGLMERFRIASPGPDAPIRALSGGNQQKAVLARWLRTGPRVVLLDEPTQGVDVVARAEIHSLVRAHVRSGCAALVASSDFDELLHLCDRILVLRGGRVAEERDASDLDADRLSYLTQYKSEATAS